MNNDMEGTEMETETKRFTKRQIEALRYCGCVPGNGWHYWMPKTCESLAVLGLMAAGVRNNNIGHCLTDAWLKACRELFGDKAISEVTQ